MIRIGSIRNSITLVELRDTIDQISPSIEYTIINRDGNTFAFEHFEIKINGIFGENISKNVVFCAYVIDNGTAYYLDNNKTTTEINGISFKDLYAVKFEKELEI